METWNEMTTRHSKEQEAFEKKYEYEWYQYRLENAQNLEAAHKLHEQQEKDKKEMIARHYDEAKAHPESPDLDQKWDDHYRPRKEMTMEEYLEKTKTEEQKLLDELRESVHRTPKSKSQSMIEELEKKAEQKKRDGWDYDQ